MRGFIFFIGLFLLGSLSFAQLPVNINIVTKDNAMALQTDGDRRLQIIYFGAPLTNQNDYTNAFHEYKLDDENSSVSNNVYTPSGTWNLLEPAIQLTHADGNNSLELKYVSHEVKKVAEDVTLTSIVLRDSLYPFQVTLFYKAYFEEDVIEQWTELRNDDKTDVTLKKFASANLYFFNSKYFLKQYHGEWAQEMQPEEAELTAGIKTLDSKLGTRANLFQPALFSLSFDRPASEEEGSVILGTLAWSGNFKIDFEKDAYNNLRLIAGINPFASEYTLQPSKTFITPSFIYSVSHQGRGFASRNLHRWARKFRLMDGNGSRLTLLNNWEATYFNFDEKKLVELFKGAKELGVDMFLLDDGWFGNKYPRNDDHAGLGDWQENIKKLPHGIGYLVKEATAAGIKFGIWVEPEMVNPKSILYEKHRDWVIRQPSRPEHYFRNQLVLDLSNPQVQDFVYGVLDTLLTKNPSLAFIKWDCNAVIYDPYSKYLEGKHLPQSQLYVDYVKGLYNVLTRLRVKFPEVPFMLCSGGGGRADYEALKYFTEFWPSDNTDPIERIYIQWENSYFFPAIVSCNHVTEASKLPLKFKVDVAMMGKMGFDIVVNKLSKPDLEFAKKSVALYKSVSDVIWHGDLYRLRSPRENDLASLMFVDNNRSRGIVFNYVTGNRMNINGAERPILLNGLDSHKSYTVSEINLYPNTKSSLPQSAVYSGNFLMKVGINPLLSHERSSVVLLIEEKK